MNPIKINELTPDRGYSLSMDIYSKSFMESKMELYGIITVYATHIDKIRN